MKHFICLPKEPNSTKTFFDYFTFVNRAVFNIFTTLDSIRMSQNVFEQMRLLCVNRTNASVVCIHQDKRVLKRQLPNVDAFLAFKRWFLFYASFQWNRFIFASHLISRQKKRLRLKNSDRIYQIELKLNCFRNHHEIEVFSLAVFCFILFSFLFGVDSIGIG